MKKILLLVLLLLAAPVWAQEATLNTPETLTVSATKLTIASIVITPVNADVNVNYVDNSGTVKRAATCASGPGAALTSFVTALDTVRASETGGVLRKMSFRALGWCADNSKFLDLNGAPLSVTLVP